jgi:hypothetical protein
VTGSTLRALLRFACASLLLGAILAIARPSAAIPAFARKYGTSCQTCHTIFPKLNPFGEAFRRNGYRFPGVDGDFVKQEPIPLGQEAYKKTFPNSVWPGTLPPSVPVSLGFLGALTLHPDKNSSAAIADNNSNFTIKDLIAEAHIWTGGSFDDTVTFFGEVTFATGANPEIEHALVLFNDLGGPHFLNLRVGKSFSTLTSFGGHSSYVADTFLPPLGVTGFFGSTSDTWHVMGEFPGVEVAGVVAGRFDYSVGFNAGNDFNVRNSQSVYAHIGVKIGGLRLDGEGGGASNSEKPWAENALTLDTFGYRTGSNYQPFVPPLANGMPGTAPVDNCATKGGTSPCLDDIVYAFGGNLRGQLGSLELNAGAYFEDHLHATSDNFGAKALTQFDELSYVVFPWFVPAVRLEYSRITPNGGISGRAAIDDLRFIPGIAALVRPNIRLTLVGQFEHAVGALPPGGSWGNANGFANPVAPATAPANFVPKIDWEVESLSMGLWVAF